MMADRILIETYRLGEEPISIEIRSPSEQFILRAGTRTTPGTAVHLYLRDEMRGKFDLFERVRLFVRHVDLPIQVTNYAGNTIIASSSDVRPSRSHLLEMLPNQPALQAISDEFLARNSAVSESEGMQVGVLLWDHKAF